MLHLFLGLKGLVKVSRYHTDGSVFRLHYRVTVTVLLAFTFIVTTRQYIAEPIMCVHSKEIPKDVLNTYCWIHPTYTLSSAHWKRVGIDVPHPGVDKTRDDRDKKHVKYYQWVGFCLFLQVRHKENFFFRELDIFLKFWSNQFTQSCFCFKLELFQKVLSVYLTFYSDLIMGLFELWLSGEILFFFWLMDTTIFITWGLIWVEIKLKKIQLRCGYIELPYSRHHNQRFIFFQPIFWRPFLCFQGNFSLKNLILT